jgi:DNA-binding NtrC family response regulator
MSRRRTPRGFAGETAPLSGPREAARLWVSFLDEPERAPVVLDRPLTVGRDAASDIRLDDESVSRLHVRLEPGTPPTAIDCESRNGTFLGSDKLEAKKRALVPPGSVLRVGGALLLVDWEPPASIRDAAPSSGLDPFFYAKEGPMAEVLEMADRLAADDISVLLTGETGVGKEVLARYLHRRSPRKKGPFVPVHAAALSASLFESELFGHERGAFTGATTERAGLFELADGGTLFFDEIGELPLDMQPKLLRVLEDRRVVRVGGRTARTVDVRILAATNRDLAVEVERGAFRSDLYFRLSAFPLALPPLRDRRAEITPMAKLLLERACAERGRVVPHLSAGALERLAGHAWPGNVRELRSVMMRALLFANKGTSELSAEDIERAISPGAAPGPAPSPAPCLSLPPPVSRVPDTPRQPEAEERARIVAALAKHAGNQSAAAEELGIARRTLVYKLDKLQIPRPRKGKK